MSTELIEKARQGDMDAFTGLFEAARPMVYAVAYRLVGPNDAEDVVMDTYLKAWKAMPAFSGRSAPRTWLCRIAHNCAIDRLRARRHQADAGHRTDEDGTEHSRLDTIPDERQRTPLEETAGAETQAQIQAALGRLSPEHRSTLMLRFADGLGYAEIARATGVSIGTVMSRLFNGRRKLMKLLKDVRGGRA
jgi:RNA polymerase sigma-70 factor (ECF subfamily)